MSTTSIRRIWKEPDQGAARGSDRGGVMAGSTTMALPVIIVLLIVQQRITSGMTAGADTG